MCLTNSLILYASVNFVKATWLLYIDTFFGKSGRLSSVGSKILAFGGHCSANFQPILDCFTPTFKLKYYDLENIKTGRGNTVVFKLHKTKQSKFFFGTPGSYQAHVALPYCILLNSLLIRYLI